MLSSEREQVLLKTELKSGMLQISIRTKKVVYHLNIFNQSWKVARRSKRFDRSKWKHGLSQIFNRSKKVVCCKFLIASTKKKEVCCRRQLSPISQRCQHFSGGKIFMTRLQSFNTLSQHKSRTKKLDGSYILPPIAHNDGQYYMKIGHHGTFEQPVGSKEQLDAWYQGIIVHRCHLHSHSNHSSSSFNVIMMMMSKEVGTLRQFLS